MIKINLELILNLSTLNPRGKQSSDKTGVGIKDKPHDLEQDDDEFDAYRKRMMLAYRFRPNPLVSFWKASFWIHPLFQFLYSTLSFRIIRGGRITELHLCSSLRIYSKSSLCTVFAIRTDPQIEYMPKKWSQGVWAQFLDPPGLGFMWDIKLTSRTLVPSLTDFRKPYFHYENSDILPVIQYFH